MARATNIACVLLVLTTRSVAAPAHDLEAGGFLGGASTNVYNTGPCPVLLRSPSTPADECVSNPHDGGHGAVLGAHLRYRVVRSVHVEANLMYVQKGYSDGVEVRLHYLEAPLVVRFDPFAEASPARAFVLAGLAPGLLVACRTSGQIFVNEAPPHAEAYSGSCADEPYVNRTPRRVDLSGVIGFGVGWQFGFGAVEIQARFVRGLMDVGGWEESGKTTNDALYVVAVFGRPL